MPSAPPPGPGPSTERGDSDPPGQGRAPTGWTAVRFRAWNLLLLVPLVVIVPPLFNRAEPSLAGLPFFYWFQIAIIPIGIACTVAVHRITRGPDEEGGAEPGAGTPRDTAGEDRS